MIRLLAARFAQSILTLWLVTVLYFLVVETAPGDFAVMTAGQSTTQEMMEETRRELGLDAGVIERYVSWLTAALHGDLGMSWWGRQPVTSLVLERLGNSLFLVFWAVLVTVPLSLVISIAAVMNPQGRIDRALSFLTLSVMSVPEFVVAYMVMFFLAVELNLFPAYTMHALDLPFWERLYACVLPVLSLIFVTVTPMFRLTRAALLRILDSDYIEMAELKGLSRRRIMVAHAFPNAIGPISNATVLSLANLFFGLVIIEIVYSYPGLGTLLVQAVRVHDMPLALGCGIISAVIIIALNFLADSASILTNPRLRYR
ncbi:MAG: ABC transporter permease [Pseudomonadota bacterium]